MQQLKKYDTNALIVLENLHQENFSCHFPHINTRRALQILHGEYQGQALLALDVTHRAWTLVGKGYLVAPLQFPVIKQLAHGMYLLLAKYRHPISQFLFQRFGLGVNTCEQGTCYEKPNNVNRRR